MKPKKLMYMKQTSWNGSMSKKFPTKLPNWMSVAEIATIWSLVWTWLKMTQKLSSKLNLTLYRTGHKGILIRFNIFTFTRFVFICSYNHRTESFQMRHCIRFSSKGNKTARIQMPLEENIQTILHLKALSNAFESLNKRVETALLKST